MIINFNMEVERIHELLYSFESSKDNELTNGLFFSMGTKVEDITQISKLKIIRASIPAPDVCIMDFRQFTSM